MEQMVEDCFEMESFGVKLAPQVAYHDAARAQRILQDTTVKVGRRYKTGLLWKDDYAVLPRSYEMAHRRLINVEKKLKRNGQLALEYDRIIKDYVRHVFDAAAKVGGTSLNSALDKGPQHYKPLPAVLFHFREGAVGVCGDIKEVFYQVLIRPKDRCSQRFLWKDGNGDQDPDVYEMNVTTFGAACSPSAAHYVKKFLKFRDSDPRAVKAIIDHHYVDDYVDSFATESEAISVSTRVKEIHAEAGFELCQFSFSSPIVEAALGPPWQIKSVGWGEAEQKILGMRWQVATDDFRFNVEYHRVPSSVLSGDQVPTKREYLSLLMSTFDPVVLCCLMTTAKLLLTEIWRQKIQWDEPLPEEIGKAFAAWRREMDAVGQFQCPRHYFGHGAVRTTELRVFVDESQSAFAAVAYWRVTYEDDNVLVSFVCAKTKCAPMRTMSIPRLELQAAVLGTRLMNTVKEEHSVDTSETVLWTDSKTVLRWIGSTHRRYKQFVGNRVAEILESSKVSQWRWVPTADNAAGDATRSQKKSDLSPESRWLSGLAFLRQPASGWPAPEEGTKRVPDAPDKEEMPSEFAVVAANEFAIPFQRFSSFSRLVRTTAWVLRFARWCRKQRSEIEEYGLTATECEAAENLLVRQAQLESLSDEMRSAECGKNVASSSEMRGLTPYVDEHGVLRVYGRVDAVLCMPYSARRPVILSHRHSLTNLIVRHFHAQMKHQNVDATIAQIRTRFWVTKMRRVLKEVISSCNECKLQRTRPMPQIMGPLPEDRLEAGGWPFKYTGFDYFGPLRLAHDLLTDSCIIAIRNFVCRRGPVHRLRSDNGKNFVGADREAKRQRRSMGADGAVRQTSAAPYPEGSRDDAENVVNSRPLTHLPVDADQEALLTPNDLLKGAATLPNTPGLDAELPKEGSTRKQWRIARMLRSRFWRRWVLEYLPTLVHRENWCRRTDPIRQGDTRKQWRIARMLRNLFWRRWVLEYLPTLVHR
ncbi:uncharacterized protein [Drosophila suzukii]|uniref:Integrase zinc-binding domain-containing protein n=1 Tax=Drosophila suzukii TaxID=28584 RepID=A0ABM4TXE1_DROSZ